MQVESTRAKCFWGAWLIDWLNDCIIYIKSARLWHFSLGRIGYPLYLTYIRVTFSFLLFLFFFVHKQRSKGLKHLLLFLWNNIYNIFSVSFQWWRRVCSFPRLIWAVRAHCVITTYCLHFFFSTFSTFSTSSLLDVFIVDNFFFKNHSHQK